MSLVDLVFESTFFTDWPDVCTALPIVLCFQTLDNGINVVGQKFRVNQYVQWNYGSGTAKGQIKETYKEKVTKTIKGSEVTRNASDNAPAYLIEQEDGDEALKSESELTDA